MEKLLYSINSLLDPTEDNSYSLIDGNTGDNKATVVIKDLKCSVYFENGDVKDFGEDIGKMVAYVRDFDYKFNKLTTGNRHWYEYNPNPKCRKIGDCTLRSYCAAFNISWENAFDIASKIAKEESSMIQYVSDKVLTEHFNCTLDEKYKKNKSNNKITINEFAITHPYGTYILQSRNHQVTVKDGNYWDSWDSGDKKVSKIYYLPK